MKVIEENKHEIELGENMSNDHFSSIDEISDDKDNRGNMLVNNPPEEILKRYPQAYFGKDSIKKLYSMGIYPEMLANQSRYMLHGLGTFIRELPPNSQLKLHYIGNNSCLVTETNTKTAVKIIVDRKQEYELLESLSKRNAELKHVIQPTANKPYDNEHNNFDIVSYDNKTFEIYDVHNFNVYEVKYVEGETIDHIVTKSEGVLPNKIIKYAGDVIEGLLELKNAELQYYRDIHPRNIIINSVDDSAMIVDLEYATNNPAEHKIDFDPDGKPHNRRFNGPSDLSSLGQLMYYMATGTSIFTKSRPQHKDLSDIADEIVAYRNMVYKDKTGLEINAVNSKIDENIQYKKLAYLIKQCLVSDHTDVERIYRLFEKSTEKVAA